MRIRNLSVGLRRITAAACFIAAAPSVLAHYLWLEREGTAARLYFGEVNEVREQSPGRLDEIPAPRVLVLPSAGAQERAAVRGRGAFLVEGTAPDDFTAVETGYAVKDWRAQGIGIVKPVFYARHTAWPARAAVPAAPALRLDVQPVPGQPDRVVVLFDGKPLAGAKLTVHAPNGWDQEQKSDVKGEVAVLLPWRGLYVLEAVHKEAKPGEFQGHAYEAVRHRATLSFVSGQGLDPSGTGALAPRLPEH